MPDLFRASDLAQAWPWSHPNQIGPSHGFGSERGYRPDWRKRNQDGYASLVVSFWVSTQPQSIPDPERGERSRFSILTSLHPFLAFERYVPRNQPTFFCRKGLPRSVL